MRAYKRIVALCLALMMALCWSGLSLAADAKTSPKEEVKKESKAKADQTKKKTLKKSAKPEPKQKVEKKNTSKKKTAKAKTTKKKAPTKPLNINTASAMELQQLNGVGPKTAQAIVDYRKKHGKFKNAEDLMKVKGVGEKTFGKNKSYIKIK